MPRRPKPVKRIINKLRQLFSQFRPRYLRALEETETETYEMTDIYEGGYVCAEKKPFFDDVLAENIKELLLQHGKILPTDSIVFPGGALCVINYEDEVYQYDFQVYRGNRVIYNGTAYGMCNIDYSDYEKTGDPCDVYAEIINLTVEIAKPL